MRTGPAAVGRGVAGGRRRVAGHRLVAAVGMVAAAGRKAAAGGTDLEAGRKDMVHPSLVAAVAVVQGRGTHPADTPRVACMPCCADNKSPHAVLYSNVAQLLLAVALLLTVQQVRLQ